ncbi:MAG: alpha/beta hydrolase [Planctomycetes bacterium]|nr:alpha/beta hydrolase [Planctomycetota bacterium]
MNATESTIRAADGTELWGRRWEPATETRGEILLVHGLGEHLGRYQDVAAGLTARGFALQGVDLRGHGRSAGRRGHVERWSDYHADLDAAARGLRRPHLVLAHSMGGLVALDWLRDRPDQVAAVVLSSPLLGVAAAAPRWKVLLGKVLARIAPRLPLSNELDPEGVCSDPKVVERYLADPLVFRSITPRWFVEMERALERVHTAAPALRHPLYLNLAGDERLVSNPQALALADAWGGAVTRVVWDRLRHETLNEQAGPTVLRAIIDWLEERP